MNKNVTEERSSEFHGVWRLNEKLWAMGVKEIKIRRNFQNEIAAAAHFNAVVRTLWPDPEDANRPPLNDLGRGLNIDPYYEDDDGTYLQIEIDADNFAILDDDVTLYNSLMAHEWFVQGGITQTITAFDVGKRTFKVQSMHEMIFGGPCEHRSGNQLDNRQCNLAAPGSVVIQSNPNRRPSYPLRDFHCHPLTPGMTKFVDALNLRVQWEKQVDLHGLDVKPEPPDPRIMKRYRKFWPVLGL